MNRRSFTFGSAAALLVASGPLPAMQGSPDAALQALLNRHYDEYLALTPRTAASNDKTGRYTALRGQLDDKSQAGKLRRAEIARRWLTELRTIDRAGLSAPLQRDYDTAAFTYESYADLLGRYGFVDMNLRPNPYVVNQMAGSYYWEPDQFARARMENAEDAGHYLQRLAKLADVLDQESERIRIDAAAGVVPPDFILARTIAQLGLLRGTPTERALLLRDPIAKARAAGLPLDAAQATRLWEGPIRAALGRQIDALAALQPRARADAGVWAQPDGESWYAAALKANTTTPMPPAEMHELGLQTVAEFSSELERTLAEQGLTRGTLKERLYALDHDPRFHVPDDDAGQEQVLAAARRDLARIWPLLPRAFRTLPTRDIDVQRLPAAIEAGSPGAFYNGAPADGSRPGLITINLQHPQEWPAWRLPTLIHHEGVPGHHLESAVSRTVADQAPPYRRLARFSAYSEGWALYAQRVADEIGVYQDDPFGRVGYLQSMLWRATRIVVDTGLHHKRWTRQQAIDWMVERSGEQVTSTEREIDRYCVLPGQACSFMYGQTRILAARERARERLGKRFDAGAFHDLLLLAGALPMPVLERMVEGWDGAAPARATA